MVPVSAARTTGEQYVHYLHSPAGCVSLMSFERYLVIHNSGKYPGSITVMYTFYSSYYVNLRITAYYFRPEGSSLIS